ncbi:MAG: complex I subunit 1/NuoH family protein [Candidatus Aminicenantia bacterium]
MIVILIKSAVAIGWLLFFTILLTWAERKESAVIQDRLGANRADILGIRLFGLFQPIADAIKMIFKEDFIPPFSIKFFYTIAPFISFFFACISIITIPFGSPVTLGGIKIPLQVVDLDVGVLFILSMASMGIWGVILGGWSSRNKYSLLGGMRATAQLISYEIPLAISFIGILMVYPSLKISEIVLKQEEVILGFLPKWGIFLQPIGFVVFLISAIAETKRIPFDLPEGESEIIGFFTEYSGMKFGMFMLTDYIETLMVAVLVTTFFFGGYGVPYLYDNGFQFPWGSNIPLHNWVVLALQIISFHIKIVFFAWFLLLVRWTLPRFRYDQLMELGWKFLIPLGVLNLILTGVILSLVKL